MTKKKPKFGAIPKLNMPKKSHESIQPTPRPGRSVVKDTNEQPAACYKDFTELCRRVKGLKCLSEWNAKNLCDRVVFKKTVDPFLIPELEIIVDDSLGFTVKVYGCYIPEDHSVYVEHRRTVRNVPVWRLVKQLEEHNFCCGVTALELTSKLFHHVIPVSEDSLQEGDQYQQFPHKGYWRSKGCWLMCGQGDSTCAACNEYLSFVDNTKKAKEKSLSKPAHVKAPVSKTNPERIKLTLQGQRLRWQIIISWPERRKCTLISGLQEFCARVNAGVSLRAGASCNLAGCEYYCSCFLQKHFLSLVHVFILQ